MSEEFKLAAEVKLKRRLKNLQRIDEKREIDQTFISCAEYQLFLDEMRAEKKFRQPDHWTEFRFPKGSALQPIAGVRAQDAKEFCEWLSQKENKKYRCPTLIEAQGFSSDGSYATWINDGYLQWNLQWNSLKTKPNIESKLTSLFKESWIMEYMNQNKLTFCSHNLDLNYIYFLSKDFNNIILFKQSLNSAFYRSLALPRSHSIKLHQDIALARRRNHSNFDIILDLHLTPNDDVLQKFLENRDFSAAQQHLQQLQPTHDIEQRRKNLLTELLTILTTDNSVERQYSWRRYSAYLAEYAVIGYNMLEKERETRSWWQRLLRHEVANYAKEKEDMAAVYAWTKIVDARQKGELPAWEGIRIVRERDV